MDSDLELRNLLFNLNKGKTILYPTDTVWGIGCDATNFHAVQKIYKIKKREESKSLIILVSSIEMLKEYIKIVPKIAIDILEQSIKPTTIIYNNPKNLAKNTIAIDNTIAIRIPNNDFCIQLIKEFGKPIVSTSANISGGETPKSFNYISDEIKKNVDYIVNISEVNLNNKPSTILKITEDNVIITLRK
ncbi:L-threonylcarbamoyladenylate synthase [Tenacibaculum haliotis]|uniref:L-threonylcarbamoyladenylate synthase n=1 Tax=Tenacibaculum haliotis TaxID=1888914 RepID=UPI0021B05B75|nr:L-threonylcarbamoyladenylate synthase [Tenacibaculum haliotis]MCT4698887.1 L-threonylcarbamoyladenylate synthase [Tenacibaculum haliotis]